MIDHTTTKMTDGGSLSDREEYFEHVEFCVDVIEERLEEDPQAEISELIWEELDSSQYLIYYGYNLHVLNHSNNEPGEWKHLVSDSDGFREVIHALAYATMEQDLWEEVRNRDLD